MSNDWVTVNWTPEKLSEFKDEYAKHQRDHMGTFSFDGHTFVVGYAKYLIEHMERNFGETQDEEANEEASE